MSEVGESCITCGDVAVVLMVVRIDGADALCRADDGGTELVAIDFVAPVEPGDRVLVHAKVALERMENIAEPVGAHERRSASGGAVTDGLRGRGTL
ncbi:MAG: HypC/HybG/HupF family hydrogenase formation chaperone [Actinomycetota bacterium]|nr:HypC/HybG/HupF family hydrogenase formation chaperone [Actinomycetota bacterium]MDQ3350616.1 HypC/HybG/HupF family hydrogenase formation chaperone [Actinomycetota bacterium]